MAQIGNNGNELTLIIPDEGKEPWYSIIYQLYTTISTHDHSGGGKGTRIGTNGISDDAINDLKILLRNNEWLKSAGVTAGDAAINMLKINGDGDLEIAPQKLVLSNGVVIDNNGANSSRFEGELTVSDDLNVEGNVLGPNLIQTSVNGLVSTKNIHVDPSDSDPVAPMDGQLQYSDGVHRAAGLWQYMSSAWVQIKRNFISEPINDLEIKLQNDGWLKSRNSTNDADVNIVRVNALDEIEFGGSVTAVPGIDSVGTPELKDNAVTRDKMAPNSVANHSNVTSNQDRSNEDRKNASVVLSMEGSYTVTVPSNGHTIYFVRNITSGDISPVITTGFQSVTLTSLTTSQCIIVIQFGSSLAALPAQTVTPGT